ncbi:MAG: FAD-dependent oxidoreductase [bacterium]|nr:FAD-dependent oxidoreductase [bacterium]
MKKIAIFGAGIAGLTVAHELSRKGYEVDVYESNPDAGGFFRSAVRSEDKNTPSEYSWHGFGPWYHNAYDIMKQIPFDGDSSVYDRSLSRPISYGVVPDVVPKAFNEKYVFSSRFEMHSLERVRWGWLMLKTWTANRRSNEDYALRNASEAWKPILSTRAWKTWRSVFGPWIGSEWARVSLHHVGLFFQKNIFIGKKHYHQADEEGESWAQGSRWLLMRGPSSDFWFKKWVTHLQDSGVTFHWETPLKELLYDGKTISGAVLSSGKTVTADKYVLAVNPFAAAKIISKNSQLEKLDQLKLFRPLIADGPHTQVSFQIAFSEEVSLTRPRSAYVLSDTEFDITLFAQEQVWGEDYHLGKNVKSLWTGTICAGTVPGRIYGLPVEKCTKAQFIKEIKAQIFDCDGLNYLIKQANGGRELKDFKIERIQVWHEWKFSPEGIEPKQPKWVTSYNTQPFIPSQSTPIKNLLLAGAHTKTDADIWSIEGAVESGRRAAKIIDPSVKVINGYKPMSLRAVSAFDDLLFRARLPHVLDLILVGATILLIVFLI